MPRAEKDFRRLLDDKAIDAVTIATPDHWHAMMTVLACQAGNHPGAEESSAQMAIATVSAKESGTFTLGGDLTVHRLGFGAMRMTGDGIWGEPRNPEECRRVLRRAVELGVNFIDTADAYGPEVSERLIGEALFPYPQGVVIATKGGLTRQGPDQWLPVGRPEYLHQQVEMSLRRLRVERIDLYQLHRIDPLVPVEDSLGKLKDLQKAGKIRHIGLSEVTPAEIERARKTVVYRQRAEPL